MITIRQIQDAVCETFEMTRDELLQQKRSRRYARPRQIGMFLAKELTDETLGEIGRRFCRDHTTVLHAIWARAGIENDPKWGPQIAAVRINISDPQLMAREKFEMHMRKSWKASIPYHLTPEGAAMLYDGKWA